MGLRDSLRQRLSQDPEGVKRALKSAGFKMSSTEEANFGRNYIDQYSDAELQERFSPKVLGMLGINESFGSDTSQGTSDTSAQTKE